MTQSSLKIRQWTKEAFHKQYIVLYTHMGMLSNTTAVRVT